MGHLRRTGQSGRASLHGDRERQTANDGGRDAGPNLLHLQSLAGNDAVGTLLSVQRGTTLADDLAGVDDDAASIGAVLRNAESGAVRMAHAEGLAAFQRGDFLHAAELFEMGAAEATGQPRTALLQNAAKAYERQGLRFGVPGAQGADDQRRGNVEQAELLRLFQQAADAFAARDYGAALAQFRRIYDQAPMSQVVWNLAVTHYRLGNYADARDYFRDFQSRGGSGADPAQFIARCDRALAGNPQLSERDLAALGESNEESMEAVVGESVRADTQAEVLAGTNEGIRLFAAHEFQAALQSFSAAAESAPDNPAVAWDMARTLQASGQYEAAVEVYRRIFR